MKTSSAKAKGRRLASKVREELLEWAPDLSERDIQITPSGLNGPDLYFSPRAEDVYPLVLECKNQEKINIWASIEQSESHVRDGLIPVLAFSRNHAEVMVCLKLENFLKLIR
jgi:hypothetical protein